MSKCLVTGYRGYIGSHLYNKLKEDKEYEAVFEKDNYSMFLRKGYLKYKNFHVTEGESLIIHSDSYILDLK